MRTFLKSLLLFVSIFAAAYAARILIVPDAVPIADAEHPGWQIQIAFILTALENIGLFGITLVMLSALLSQLRNAVTR